MIKLLQYVRRKPELTPEQFQQRWRDGQQRFFAAHSDARALVNRAELNHRIPEDYVRSRHDSEFESPEWDGVAVYWFDDETKYRAFRALPAVVDLAAQECADYRMPKTAEVVAGDERVIVDRPGGRARAGLKLMCILHRSEKLKDDRAHFLKHWREHHGGLFQNVPELNDPVLAYDQNHGIADAEYDGVTEQWFESLPAWIESLTVPANFELVEPDVAYFLDPNSIAFILAGGQPTVVVGK
jgi:hypothetical protein